MSISSQYQKLAEMTANKIKEIIYDNYEGEAEIEVGDYIVEVSYNTEFEHHTGATSTRMFHPDIVEEWYEPVAYYAEIMGVWDAEGDPDKDAVIYINRIINELIN